MAVRTQTFSQQPRFNVRAWLAFLFGVLAAAAIPVAAVAATLSLLFARGARGAIARTLEPVGGAACIRLGRILAVAGICITLSASIAVGLYELLLRLEH